MTYDSAMKLEHTSRTLHFLELSVFGLVLIAAVALLVIVAVGMVTLLRRRGRR